MAAQTPQPKVSEDDTEPKETASTPQHEINKTAVIVGVVGVVALLFIVSR